MAAGTDLRLDVPEPAALDLEPAPEIPLTIVYEDDDLLILDKPAGLVVHPAPGHSGDTLVNALLAHGDGRPGAGSPASSGRGSSTASTATRAVC